MAQTKNGYIPPNVQREMDQHMQRMPAHLQKYQSGQTYIPTQARQEMANYMEKSMPAHMKEYINPYMHQQVTAGLSSLDPVRSRPIQPRAASPDLMRRDHSAPGEQLTVNVASNVTPDTPRSLSFSPQYSSNNDSVPPAPPPMQPVTRDNNPYDFITQNTSPAKKGLLSGGSKKQHILIILIGLMVLGILAAIIIGMLGSSAAGPKDDYLSLLQQQTELIRISKIGTTKAKSSEAKNLAYTTAYSLTTEQPALIKLAKKARAPTDGKTLAGGKNSKTDALLTDAAQTNQFDTVFTKTMQTNLKKYQETLKKIYDETTAKTSKDILTKDYDNATVLIGITGPPQ